MSDRDGSGFLWFLAGLGIGAAVGILYAPKAGDEIRQQLREVAEDGRDTVKDRRARPVSRPEVGRQGPRLPESTERSDSLRLRGGTPSLPRSHQRERGRHHAQRSLAGCWKTVLNRSCA